MNYCLYTGDCMKEKILSIIKKENKKEPLTDEKIAELLNIDRTSITKIRKEADIPSSRDRKIENLTIEIRKILNKEPDISNSELTRSLNNLGYKVGKYVVGQITSNSIVHNPIEKRNKIDIFNNLIGYNKSLKVVIEQLKAAIIYPPKGLHTILSGSSGVGKSYLAKLAHSYAITTDNFANNAPFYEFNCADYAENPQLLVSQLFGYSKGAFTGADEAKKGIVELCDGGILFLDEVHRLPPEGQEILFSIIDNNTFKRLGDNKTNRKTSLMIIAATTENIDSSLLLTFKRRIPMNIKIPDLNERDMEEKIELIKYFLYNESLKLNKEIILEKEAFSAFLDMSYPGNIGQLKSDIQVCCAKAFLEAKINNSNKLRIKKEFIIDISNREKIITNLSNLSEEYKVIPNKKNKWNDFLNDNNDIDIYDKITLKYDEMIKSGVNKSNIITRLLEKDLQNEFSNNINKFYQEKVDYKELRQLIGSSLLDSIIQGYEYAKEKIPTLDSKIIFPLSIHLNSSIKRIEEKKYIYIPIPEDFENSNKENIEISKNILNIINKNIPVELPLSEIIFINIFLNEFKSKQEDDSKISLLVLSHGKVANGMAEVANKILGETHAVGLEMDFSDSPEYMFEKTSNLVKQINQGKGCIILADMGSLLEMENKLTERTGIEVKIVGNVYTLMVIECLRKVLYTSDSLLKIIDDLKNLKI